MPETSTRIDQASASAGLGEATVRDTARTRTVDELVQQLVQGAGYLRNQTRILGQDVAQTDHDLRRIHQDAFGLQLSQRARSVARRSAVELLNSLADAGFAWRDVARLVGVSVPALRRWRQGEPPTGPHLQAITKIVAFKEILETDHFVQEVASWMEIPISPEAPVTPLDVAADGSYEALLELAAEQASPEEVLDRWDPDWRERFGSEFEVFEVADGELGIRRSAGVDRS
jgi:transcriptional regulator with XRE-family HTH domain